jgi:hypothetical protein
MSTPIFLRYEIDADGHAYQLLSFGDERLELYPPLDAISLQHALEVEGTVLPAIVELFEASPGRASFDAFHVFFDRLRRIQEGDGTALRALDEVESRVLEAVRSSINEHTPPDEVRRRCFARFYQYAICDNHAYRTKARQSLERLVGRVGAAYEHSLEDTSSASPAR